MMVVVNAIIMIIITMINAYAISPIMSVIVCCVR